MVNIRQIVEQELDANPSLRSVGKIKSLYDAVNKRYQYLNGKEVNYETVTRHRRKYMEDKLTPIKPTKKLTFGVDIPSKSNNPYKK